MVLGKRLLRGGSAGTGSPTAYGGVGPSPHKRKSPFKRRISGISRSGGGNGEGVSANIRVAVRVRPENEREEAGAYRNVIEVVDDQMLIFDPKEDEDEFYFHGRRQNQRRDLNKSVPKDHKFTFDVVLGPQSTNEDVFVSTTKDLVDVLFQGYNCSVFVYGATGAGKTFTMLGSQDSPGITFKTVMEIYNRIEEKREDCTCEIAVSYLEVYNETIVDLINENSGQLAMREDGKSSVNIPGLSIHKPNGPDELLRLLQYGNSNRQQHPTDANKESSRSHAVFQVILKQKGRNEGLSGQVKVAKLSMIDLAGSEKGSATSSRERARFREGANINKSLLALGNCINALAEGSKYIPYRNSKLTRLLKDSIGGNCRTVMISNVSPSSMSFEDTYNTLKYADRAKKIKTKLKKNVLSVDFHVGQYAKIVEDLKSEISILKRKISSMQEENDGLRDELSKKPKSTSDNEELDSLRAELEELQERQADYDDLQRRLKEFEEGHHQAPLDATVTVNAEPNQTSVFDAIQKCFKETSRVKLMELHKQLFKAKVDRSSAISPGTSSQTIRRLGDYLKNVDRKISKTLRRCKKAELKKMECIREASMTDSSTLNIPFKELCYLREQQHLNDHLLEVIKLMALDRERTEEILLDSLKQLKRSHLLLRSHGHDSEDTASEFQSLVDTIQCSKVQFRDSLLQESNLDDLEDRILSPVRKTIDLQTTDDISSEPTASTSPSLDNLDEEDEEDKDTVLEYQHLLEKDTSRHDNEDEEETKVVWRPPTPPKASPQTKTDNQPAVPSILQSPALKGSSAHMDETFDVNKTFDVSVLEDAVDKAVADTTVVLEEPVTTSAPIIPTPENAVASSTSSLKPEGPLIKASSSFLRSIKPLASKTPDSAKVPNYMAQTTASSSRRFTVASKSGSSLGVIKRNARTPSPKSRLARENKNPSKSNAPNEGGLEKKTLRKAQSVSALRQLNK